MFRHVVTALALILSFGVAHAADTGGSEFFHQATGGTSEVTPHLSYLNSTFKAGTLSTTTSGVQHLGAQYEYGFNEMLAFYGNVAFGSLSTGSNSNSGLEDPNIGVKGTYALGMGNFRYGVDLVLGFQNATNSNLASGGYALSPYVGYDMVAGPGMIGVRLLDKIQLTRTIQITSGTQTTTGGNDLALSAFYEYMLSDMVLGGQLRYDTIGDTSNSYSVGASGGAGPGGANGGMFAVGFYSRVPMGMGALLPSVEYATHTGSSFNGNAVDSLNNLVINLGYRILF